MKVSQDLREKILTQLADPESMQIIASLLGGKKTTVELGEELGLPSTTLYRKISELRECGLLMVDSFGFRANGRREARYTCSFTEITMRTGHEGIELDVVPSARGLERGWFELFFSRRKDPERPG